MPRPKHPDAPEPKRRSRNGCWPCKARKVKCGEEHPTCKNCLKTGEACDYSIRLIWEGRRIKRPVVPSPQPGSPPAPDNFRDHWSPSLSEQTWSPSGSMPSMQQAPTSQPFDVDVPEMLGHQTAPLSFTNTFGPASYQDQLKASSASATAVSATTDPIAPGLLGVRSTEDTQRQTPLIDEPRRDQAKSTSSGRPSLRRSNTHSPPLRRTKAPLPSKGPIAKVSRRRHKRAKSVIGSLELDGVDVAPQTQWETMSAHATMPTPLMSHLKSMVSSPLTPGAVSSHSDDILYNTSWTSQPLYQSPSPWYSGNSDLVESPAQSTSQWDMPEQYGQAHHQTNLGGSGWEAGKFYGYDLGKQDEDIVINDDANAILQVNRGIRIRDNSQGPVEPGEVLFRSCPGAGLSAAEPGPRARGLHDQMTAVLIPWELEPLPDKLQDNPMDLLYFHHFLNHTAKVLVPYHDPQSNPFRTILPKMAMENDQLLSLVLAYAASHRARLLQTTEPAMRMAQWVEEIFPVLRGAVSNTQDPVSNANLAAAVMLASLEIISPMAFGYAIPWQQHLNLAREMMCRRLTDLKHRPGELEEDRDCWFLWSWFAYLDVLGSFTSKSNGTTSPVTWLQDFVYEVVEDMDEIDCIMGFTIRCVSLLAQTAELARQCDSERISLDGRVWPDWVPSSVVLQHARKLEADLLESLEMPFKLCRHMNNGNLENVELAEIMATNRAFHLAGLLQLQRRVLGKSNDHEDVQGPVREILQCMEQTRTRGSAETGFLFPMFTAGCEARDERERAMVLERFKSAESSGMMQVCRARMLMEKSWKEGRSWETLAENEFIG